MILYISGGLISCGAIWSQSTPMAIVGVGLMISAVLLKISEHLRDKK